MEHAAPAIRWWRPHSSAWSPRPRQGQAGRPEHNTAADRRTDLPAAIRSRKVQEESTSGSKELTIGKPSLADWPASTLARSTEFSEAAGEGDAGAEPNSRC